MASHFRLGKYQIFTAGVQSGTNTITSSTVHILNLDNIYLQINNTGTANGSYAMQVSNDHTEDQEGNVLVAGNWVTIPASMTIAAGAPATIGIDLNQRGAPWFRLQYTNTSGSGTVNAFVSGKGLM